MSWNRADTAGAARTALRCRCGRKGCNCAVWDRIYREKFEDPSYYTRPLSLGSPLAGIEHLAPDLDDLWEISRPKPKTAGPSSD